MKHDPRVEFILSFFGQDLASYSVKDAPVNKTSIFLAEVGLPRKNYYIGIHEERRLGEIIFHSPLEENQRIYFAYIERFSRSRLYIDCSTQHVRITISSSSDGAEIMTEPYCSDIVVFLCQVAIFASLKVDGRNFSELTRAVDLFQFVDFESKMDIGMNFGMNNLIQLCGETHEIITQHLDETTEVKPEIISLSLGNGPDTSMIARLLVPEYYKLLPILINFMELGGDELSLLVLSTYSSEFQQYDAEWGLDRKLWHDTLCSAVLHRNATPEMMTAMTRHSDPVVRATAMLALKMLTEEAFQGMSDVALSERIQDRIYMIPDSYYVAVPEVPETIRRLEQGLSETILEQFMRAWA